MIKIGENPINAVITLSNVWRCGTYLYKGEQGNCKVVLNISVDQDKRFHATMDGPSRIQITLNPDCEAFVTLSSLLETMDGQPGQMWKWEYGDDKSFTLDTNLTQELARLMNAYRLAF